VGCTRFSWCVLIRSDRQRGAFFLSLCGKSEACDGDDSVCVASSSDTKKGIASYTSSSIMVDGESLKDVVSCVCVLELARRIDLEWPLCDICF